MSITQKHYDRIKADFEKDKGWLLSLQFTNNQHLVKDFLTVYPDEQDISFEATNIEWNVFSNERHEEVNGFTIKTSLRALGHLIIYDQLKEINRRDISLDLTMVIPCRYVPESDMILYLPESIVVMTDELKTITSFDAIVLKEFHKLSILKPLDFGIMDRIWPFNEKNNDTHVFVSGYGYFSEIENIYRQVRYSIALANTYAHYGNRYFLTEVRQPFLHYPINFTSHDRRYLDFCTSAIQSMYVYWERLAVLIYQYYQPSKVNERNLSFAKLIGAISKDLKDASLAFDWFTTFLNDDHSRLQLLRHPLVHFKLDPVSSKGSYIPMIFNQWLKNTKDKNKLLEMEMNSKALVGEIIELAQKCQEGYEKTIQLIVDIKKGTSAAPINHPSTQL